jgi:NitT/TauT family transport system substrate-binding protein
VRSWRAPSTSAKLALDGILNSTIRGVSMNMRVKGLLCLALVGVLAGTDAEAAAVEKPRVQIAVGSKVGLFFLPTMVAEHLGYYKDEGLDVEIVDLGSGGKALQALVGRSVDVTSGAYDHTVQLAAKNIQLQAFVLQSSLADYAVGVVKSKAASYKSPKDLKGMRIGVSSPGAGSDMFLKLVLAKAGMNPDDVSVINVGLSSGAIAAVRKGALDAIANNDPVMTVLEETGEVKVIADARTHEGSKTYFGGDYPTAALFAHADFIQKNPNTVQALTNAVVRALRWLSKATPEQVMAALPPEFAGGDPAMYKKILAKLLPTYSPDGLFPANSGEIAHAALAQFVPSVREAKIDLGKTFDNRFVQKALARHK